MRRAWAAGVAVAIAIAVAPLALPTAALGASSDDDPSGITVTVPEPADSPAGGIDGEGRIDDAEFRWGVNTESGSGAFAGGCNFLSAGVAGDAGGAREWRQADGLYASRAGNTRIVKATASGAWAEAAWDTKCLDRGGRPVSVTSLTAHTESQVVIDGGEGEVGPDGADIRWDGAFTVALYGGMTYWSASDPHLVIDAAGNGRVTAHLSGFATSREDMSKWAPLDGGEVVIAEIRGAEITASGFAQAPEYLGVTASVPGQARLTLDNADHWGAFPGAFLTFQERIGQAGYWMTTGGQRDRAKVPTTLYVSYDAARPVAAPPDAPPQAGTGELIRNPITPRTLTAQGLARGGAPLRTTTAAALDRSGPVVATATVSRDDVALIPSAFGALPPFATPLAATVLAALIATLAALQLAGVRILPWPRRGP
ncbi:hypothetical protein [Microbacterium rhizophilus]|uniref:hypothetical protein n=1 Tax=Microbacterium rhizophilus TaxID=3138934 RepID=UPI0031E52805